METTEKEKFETVMEKPTTVMQSEDGTNLYILTEEDENMLENGIKEIQDFMDNNPGDSSFSEERKEELYNEVQAIWNTYGGKSGKINEVKYGLILSDTQGKYLLDLLRNKIEYDVNTMFFAIELAPQLLELTKAQWTKNTAKEFYMTSTDITYLYTTISGHKVKGLGKDTYNFAEIIRRIGEISKVINHYDSRLKEKAEMITKWIMTFEDGVSMEESIEEKSN